MCIRDRFLSSPLTVAGGLGFILGAVAILPVAQEASSRVAARAVVTDGRMFISLELVSYGWLPEKEKSVPIPQRLPFFKSFLESLYR